MTPRKKKTKSLLTRFLKSGGKKKGKPGTKESSKGSGSQQGRAATKKLKPLTPRERSIAEIKQMKRMGDNSPERLARILSTMLGKEREKSERDQEMFDQMIRGIIRRQEKREDEGKEEPPP
tara:strand:+ start:82 stop:444 length:363 start_codon:yes stop_codon:yes gene_type:complete